MLFFLFSNVLNKLFHITDVCIYSTRQNNNWIYENYPIQKFTHPWILYYVSFPGWSTTVFIFCELFMSPSLVLNSSTVCYSSEESSSSGTFFGFPASSAYLNLFQKWLCDFEIHICTLRTTEGLKHNYYKRCKHLLMLKKATQCIKGIVHPIIKILSSFTHPQVVTNLYECVCSAEHKGRYFEESL